jgi:arylsulfatase A-like enzyme
MNKGPFHFDGILNVPNLWRFPGRFKPGVSTSLTSHLDFAPTILDLAGVPVPETGLVPGNGVEAPRQLSPWAGRSLKPLLEGAVDKVQDCVSVENDEDYLGLRLRTLVTGKHQLTSYVGEAGEEPYGELFDLEEDPGQLHNLWDDPAQKQAKNELKARLMVELVRTDNRLPRRQAHA